MAKNIEPQLAAIGKYLSIDEDTVFVIPEYQRAYSWTKENCDKLWQDILDYSEAGSKDNYFFGTVIVNCQDNDTRLALIDGQQRTTTFYLLLKALLMRINERILRMTDDEDSIQLLRGLRGKRRSLIQILYKAKEDDIPDEPDEKIDASIYRKVELLENFSINERYKDDFNRIIMSSSYEEAERSTTKIPYKQKDNKFTNFFRNFKFFYNEASLLSDSQINSIAEKIIGRCEIIEIKSWKVDQAITMFNSLNSDGLPLYDSDIISAKLYANAESQGLSRSFGEAWEELKEQVDELSGLGICDLDSILMQQMYYEKAARCEIIGESGSPNVTMPGLRRYFTEINKDLLSHPVELCNDMNNIARIWKKTFEYPSVQVLSRFNENFRFFLATYFHRFRADEITEKDVAPLADAMIRLFAILELVDAGYSSRNFKTFLFSELERLADPSVLVSEIIKDFSDHIGKTWNRADIKASISDYSRNPLVFLNEYLVAGEDGVQFSIGTKYDIEHILPYSGGNIQVIRIDAGIITDDEFYGIVNKLGNKILLEQKINRSIGNEWFRTKVSMRLRDKSGYVDSIYPMARQLVLRYRGKDKAYWTKQDIEEATNTIEERIVGFIFSAS
mgnify:CR=1 FL=1